MTNTITFSTGRTYDAPQILQIDVLESETDDFGFVSGKATFVDHSRYIFGTVDYFLAFGHKDSDIGEAVLSAYDSGAYKSGIYAQCK